LIWKDFKRAAPDLAKSAEAVLGSNGLALIGTIRRDGTPRISPVEVFFPGEELLLGMMKRSRKALDLLRDPRCVVHNTVSDPEGSQPELKLRGRAISGEEGMVERYCEGYAKRWKSRPPKSFPGHVFSLDVADATLIRYETEKGEMIVTRWRAGLGVSETRRSYP
jgi:Pyridoxamine 5'-phosphate oxidase